MKHNFLKNSCKVIPVFEEYKSDIATTGPDKSPTKNQGWWWK